MSFTPPAENGTTSLIGRLGNAALRECARRGERGRGCGEAELRERRVGSSELLPHHCTLNPVALMIGVQRASSLATSRCAASGPESSTGSKPDVIIGSCTCVSAIAARGLVGEHAR